jgi:hypothetical protein
MVIRGGIMNQVDHDELTKVLRTAIDTIIDTNIPHQWIRTEEPFYNV